MCFGLSRATHRDGEALHVERRVVHRIALAVGTIRTNCSNGRDSSVPSRGMRSIGWVGRRGVKLASRETWELARVADEALCRSDGRRGAGCVAPHGSLADVWERRDS